MAAAIAYCFTHSSYFTLYKCLSRSDAKGDALLRKCCDRLPPSSAGWLMALLATGHLLLAPAEAWRGSELKPCPLAEGFKHLVFLMQTWCLQILSAC